MGATNAIAAMTIACRWFQALSDETRLRIVLLLADGEQCVCTIHETLDLPQSSVSRHLAVLRQAGLVAARRDGRWVHYRIPRPDDPVLARIVKALAAADWTPKPSGRSRCAA